jgi:hypothetical protein
MIRRQTVSLCSFLSDQKKGARTKPTFFVRAPLLNAFVLSARLINVDQYTVKLVSKLVNNLALTVPKNNRCGCSLFSGSSTHYRVTSTEMVRIQCAAHSFSAFRSRAEWRLPKPTRVASGGNVGGREAAVEPTRTYSRRFPQEVTRVGGSIA